MSFYRYSEFLRLVGTSEEQLAAACRHPDVVFAYVAGSAVENHATAVSDLDMYVITRPSNARRAARLQARLRAMLEPVPVDIAVVQRAVVDRLVRTAGERATLTLEDFSFLHRLFHSNPLVGGETYRAVRSALDYAALCRRLATTVLADVHKLARDVEAMADLGELESAYLASVEALRLAGQAILLANGMSLDRPKWLLWKLTQLTADRDLAAEVSATLSGGCAGGLRPACRQAGLLASRVAEHCTIRVRGAEPENAQA